MLGCYLYDFASAMIIAIPEWKAEGFRRGRHGHTLPGAVNSRVVSRYVKEFRKSSRKRAFSEAVWNRFKTKVC